MAASTPEEITVCLMRAALADHPWTALRGEQDLLTLGYIVALASGEGGKSPSVDQLASILLHEIGTAADALEEIPEREPPNRARAARAAFGLWSGTQNLPFRGGRRGRGRLPEIAMALAKKDPSTVTRAAPDGRMPVLEDLVESVAVVLNSRETEFIAEGLRLRQRTLRRPEETKLGVNWIDQYEQYMRIWAPVSGVRWSVKQAIDAHRKGLTDRFEELGRDSLYFCGKYVFRLYDYEDRRGALWIFPTREGEDAVGDATWKIHAMTPLHEIDKSLLRRALRSSIELADFVEVLSDDERYTDMLRRWKDWLLTCACEDVSGPGDEDCAVHQATRGCDTYMEVVQKEFEKIADWYLAPGRGPGIGPHVDLSESWPAQHG